MIWHTKWTVIGPLVVLGIGLTALGADENRCGRSTVNAKVNMADEEHDSDFLPPFCRVNGTPVKFIKHGNGTFTAWKFDRNSKGMKEDPSIAWDMLRPGADVDILTEAEYLTLVEDLKKEAP